MERSKLILWVALIFLTLLVFIFQNFTGRYSQFGLTEFVNVAVSLFGMISSSSLIYQAVNSQQLMRILGSDIIVLFVGAATMIWVSMQQIWQLFN